jgi:hypothetical protein
VTKKDLGKRLRELADPFVTLGEIERSLRTLIERGDFAVDELRSFVATGDAGGIETLNDLTLGQYQRLLEHPAAWARVRLSDRQGHLHEATGRSSGRAKQRDALRAG